MQEQRDELIKEYSYLVKIIAHTFVNKFAIKSIEMDDLIQSGMMGLIDAASKFDPTRKSKFKAYANIRIYGAIIDFMRTECSINRHFYEEFSKINYAHELLNVLGKDSSTSEVSKMVGSSEDRVNKVKLFATRLQNISIEEIDNFTEREKKSLFYGAEKNPSILDEIISNESKELLNSMIDILSEKERYVLRQYFFKDKYLKEIGKSMNVTESRTSQLLSSGINKLRTWIKQNSLEEFFF